MMAGLIVFGAWCAVHGFFYGVAWEHSRMRRGKYR